jgi:Tfp pilus assembly protein PilF
MRKLFIIIVGCTGLLLLGYVGYRSYKIWQQQHLLTMARMFFAANDPRNATLSLALVLRANPQNLEASRMMANIRDATHEPSALFWRNKVVELNPASLADRVALAQTAMTMKDLATANKALDGVSPSDKKTAIFQNTAGAVAAASNQPRVAVGYFQEAVRLEPQNPVPLLNLAILLLHSTNKLEFAQGKDSLQRLAANPTNSLLRCSALRELVGEDLRTSQNDTAVALSKQLLKETNATFGDKILLLTSLYEVKSPDYKATLAGYQSESVKDPVKAYELATWLVTKEPPTQVEGWLKSLPDATRTNVQVELFTAECSTMAKDWTGVQNSLTNQNWGEVDFLRHAFLSRAYTGLGLSGTATAEWGNAKKDAAGQETSLTMLLHVAVGFGMNNEAEELLLMIVQQYSANKWAPQLLVKDYLANGRTASLLALWRQQLKTAPNDLDLKNNVANLSMLLNTPDTNPYELAKEVYQVNSTNASYATTYAFALYQQGKYDLALKTIEQLKPQELEVPETAGYYGLILKAKGDRVKARKYFDLSTKAGVLPEERQLFDRGRAGN